MSDVSLKEYLENMIASHHRETQVKHDAMELALRLAREEIARRLTDLNQLRSEVIEDRDQFVTKVEFDPMMRERDAWRESISDRVTKIETRGNTWTVAIGLFFVVLQIALTVFLKR